MQQVSAEIENRDVQNVVEFSLAWLEERNYTLTVDVDMAGWVERMRNAPSIALVNPTFDPRHSQLSPANSFWLDIRKGSHTVAMMASRVFDTQDYAELMRSRQLWYRSPPAEAARLEISWPAGLPVVSGRVGHEGGLWIDPEHRKRGLSVIVPHLNRALAFRQWNLDWQTGLALGRLGESGIVTQAYGMRHVFLCFEGISPLNGRHDRLFTAYMGRDELVAGLDPHAIAGLLADRYQQVRDASVIVKKRYN